LNLSNFKIIEAIRLKWLHRGSLEWHYLRTKFIKIYQAVEKLLVGNLPDRHTNRQTDWWFDKSTFIFAKYAKNDLPFIMFLIKAVNFSAVITKTGS
jgi:hypothetical protein